MLLGRKTPYKDSYDKTLLYPIVRAQKALAIQGFDLWNCYELSWLNINSKPIVKILEFIVSADSKNIIESKSVKLYLNSFHNTKFNKEEEVSSIIQNDLSEVTESQVTINIRDLKSYENSPLTSFRGENLDLLDVKITDLSLNKSLLKLDDSQLYVKESLHSNLFKSNCLVTGQPDWASVQINYEGYKINHGSLLQYLISFRTINEFAEPCAENIFTDIMHICTPQKLTVYMRFTRRGGVDINPIRSSHNLNIEEISNFRQVRQ